MKHETIDCRRDARRPTYITGKLRMGSSEHPCWLRDLSAGGALIFAEVPVTSGDRMVLEVDDKKLAAYVRWTDYPLLGVQFETGSMVTTRKTKAGDEARGGLGLRARLSESSDSESMSRMRRWWNGR